MDTDDNNLPFHDLPDYYISKILEHLDDPEDLIQVSLTSKRMRQLAQDRNQSSPLLVYPSFVARATTKLFAELPEPTDADFIGGIYTPPFDVVYAVDVILNGNDDEGLSRLFDTPFDSRRFTAMFFPEMFDGFTEEELAEWNDPDWDHIVEFFVGNWDWRFVNAYSKWTWYGMTPEARKAAMENPEKFISDLSKTFELAVEGLYED
jgi:hypothetical protein